MNSFSKSSFASDHAEALEPMLAAIRDDPRALFTDFQWFLFEARDTVFFTAFSKHRFDEDQLVDLVAQMVSLAPQLSHGFVGAKPGRAFALSQLRAITSVDEVETFDGYPDKWLSISADIFARDDLPLFRVMVANRKRGPDAEGRASIIQVRAAHAVLEGSDSALLTRSQPAGHGIMSDKENKVSLARRLRGELRGLLMTSAHLFFGNVLSPPDTPTQFRTLALSRDRMRDIAGSLAVRQRSLYFALVTYALFGTTDRRHDRNAIVASYTMLDNKRTAADDDFFRVRTLEAKFPFHENFADFAREVDVTMDRLEQEDTSKFQIVINSMFSMHRKLHAIAPWIYSPRFWRFGGTRDVVLTLVPPHRSMGPLTEWMIEPIYCGAYHPATNICTFCPGREYMTLNFTMDEAHIQNVDKIMALIERVEALAGSLPNESRDSVSSLVIKSG
jgi:hypothetical protein